MPKIARPIVLGATVAFGTYRIEGEISEERYKELLEKNPDLDKHMELVDVAEQPATPAKTSKSKAE